MDVYQAATIARAQSKEGNTFRIEFWAYDESTGKTGGTKAISQCVVRPGNPDDKNDDMKLALYNVERDEHRSCWIPLIKSINGVKVITP